MQMNNTHQKFAVSALVVGAPMDAWARLAAIFVDQDWKIGHVDTRTEARRFLDNTPVRVVISERDLPEGDWLDMLEDLSQHSEPPSLLVTSRLADESLWAEVSNRGGYDVLAQPLDGEECACSQRGGPSFRKSPPTPPVAPAGPGQLKQSSNHTLSRSSNHSCGVGPLARGRPPGRPLRRLKSQTNRAERFPIAFPIGVPLPESAANCLFPSASREQTSASDSYNSLKLGI